MTAHVPSLVDLAVDRMLALDRHFELNLWPAHSVSDRRHDIAVMASHADLAALTTELLSSSNIVLFAYEIDAAQPLPQGEIHWPLIDRSHIGGGRLIVRRHGREAIYRNRLRLNWSPARTLQREPGDLCAAGAAGSSFHLGQGHRRQLVVAQAGPRFAFADFADQGACRAHVFLLSKWAIQPGLMFHVGQRLSALVVTTPKGLQGRAIRPD